MQVANVAPLLARAQTMVQETDDAPEQNLGIRMAIAHVHGSQNLTRAEKASFIASLKGIEEAVAANPKVLLMMMNVIAMAEAEHEREGRSRITSADTAMLPPIGSAIQRENKEYEERVDVLA